MTEILLAISATLTVTSFIVFFAAGLMFSRRGSTTLAAAMCCNVIFSWSVANSRDYDIGSVLVVCGALIAALGYGLIAYAAGEN